MKTNKLVLAICCLALLAASCKSTVFMIGFWANKDKPQPDHKRSLFIMVLTADLHVRDVMETDLKEAALSKGFKVTTSIEALGPINVGKKFPADAILKKVKDLGMEAIFTVAVKDINTESHYVRASDNFYNPMGTYNYYGNFGNYYGNYWGGTSFVIGTGLSEVTPGYTLEKKTYYLESNLYETSTQDLLLSIQTKAVDPSSLNKASKEYTSKLVSLIESERKLQKK